MSPPDEPDRTQPVIPPVDEVVRSRSGTLRGGTETPRRVDVEVLARELRTEDIDLSDVFEDQPASREASGASSGGTSSGQAAHRAAAVQKLARAGGKTPTSSPPPPRGDADGAKPKVMLGPKAAGSIATDPQGAASDTEGIDEAWVALPAARPQDPTAVSVAAVSLEKSPASAPSPAPSAELRRSSRGVWLGVLVVLGLGLGGAVLMARFDPAADPAGSETAEPSAATDPDGVGPTSSGAADAPVAADAASAEATPPEGQRPEVLPPKPERSDPEPVGPGDAVPAPAPATSARPPAPRPLPRPPASPPPRPRPTPPPPAPAPAGPSDIYTPLYPSPSPTKSTP